jgi:hypothetical protein
MAFEIGDGFDFYGSTGFGLGGTCWSAGGPWAIATQYSRFGVGLGVAFAGVYDLTSTQFGNDAVVYVNFAMVLGGSAYTPGNTTVAYGFTLYDTTFAQVGCWFRQDGSLIVTNGLYNGTVLATAAGPWFTASNQWRHFQFKVTISNTTGRVEIRQDGHIADDYDSGAVLNTRNGSANSYCNKINFEGRVSNPWMDDFYLFNDQGIAPNTWQGDVRAVQLMPTTDSSVTWTRSTGASNFSCVDEPSENGDTDYVSTLTVNNVDQYGTSSLATTPNAIIGIVTKALVRMDDVGPHSVKTRLTSNSIVGDSATLSLSSTYQWLWANYMTDPSGGAAWTAARTNAATIGPFCVS